jgi:pimeloyl-ACP methyl ester carboxylesterase
MSSGAWSWYRAASAYRVTALDMAGRGEEVASFEAYSRPLLDALPECDKAVLVAHSFAGQSLALATERHRRKSPRCRVRQGHHARRKVPRT